MAVAIARVSRTMSDKGATKDEQWGTHRCLKGLWDCGRDGELWDEAQGRDAPCEVLRTRPPHGLAAARYTGHGHGRTHARRRVGAPARGRGRGADWASREAWNPPPLS